MVFYNVVIHSSLEFSPAHVVAGVVEVVGVAPEGGVVAQVLAVLLAGDGLVNRVHRLQDLALRLVIQAELFRLVDSAVGLEGEVIRK